MKKSRKKRLRRLAERVVDRHRRRQQQGEISGIIRMTVSGFGFVTPDSEKFPDIDGDVFIPAKFVNGAIDGDQVQVSLLPPGAAVRKMPPKDLPAKLPPSLNAAGRSLSVNCSPDRSCVRSILICRMILF